MSDIVQTAFNYSELDEAKRIRVQIKAESIRVKMKRSAEDIIGIGQDLIDAKHDVGHGRFKGWLKAEFDMTYDTAINFMQVARKFGQRDEIKNGIIPFLPATILYEIAGPKMPEQIVEGVLSGDIDPTPQAIKDAKEALKKAEEAERKAREEAQLAQRQLFTTQSTYQTQIAEYTRQINELKQEMADLVKPEVQIKEVEVIPQTVKDQLQRLQDKAKLLTEQRDNLSRINKQLSADLDVVEAKREQEARDARIRLQFQKLTKATYDALVNFATQIPMNVDLPVLEPDDWARVEELASTMNQISERLFGLHKSMTNQFVDASTGLVVEA
jgi:hypothetical protein